MGFYQRILLFLLLFLSCTVLSVHCKNKRMRLLGEDAIDKKALNHNRDECVFGKEFYEIGAKWHPDLGEPFGVYHCVTCECVQEKRKRKMIGRTRCKPTECPDVTCNTEPIKIAGQCCKICPNLTSSDTETMLKDIPPQTGDTEEDPGARHFFSVLTSQTARNLYKGSPLNANMDLAATARFELHNRHLYFSLYCNRRPKSVQFQLANGDIIEEQTFLSNSFYEQETGKTCGVWRRLSKESKRHLRDEKLFVTLVWEDIQMTSGQVRRHKSLLTEQYSSLLHNAAYDITGTAFIALSTTTPSMPSVHLTVLFSTPPHATVQKDIFIGIKLEDAHNRSSLVNEVVKLEKWQEVNSLEVSGVTTSDLLNKLSRHTHQAKVTVTILGESPTPPVGEKEEVSGHVIPRIRCEMLQALLSYSTKVTDNTIDPVTTGAHGLAWMFFDSTNTLRYFVQLEHTQPESVSLAKVNKDKIMEVEDLSRSWSQDWSQREWVNGSLNLSPHLIEALNSGTLILNVGGSKPSNPSLIRGFLKSKLVADASLGSNPWLFDYKDVTSAEVVALVWVSFDEQCDLHYEVHVTGLRQKIDIDFYMKEAPALPTFSRAPITKSNIRHFYMGSTGFEGVIRDLSNDLIARLNVGVVSFEIVDSAQDKSLLKTKWNKLSVPVHCLPSGPVLSPDSTLHMSGDDNSINSAQTTRCYHGGIFYRDGDVWSSMQDQCTMCNCQSGRTVCDPMVCPPVKCRDPVTREGDCCPMCPPKDMFSIRGGSVPLEANTSRGCILREQFHRPGSSWYPYIPPHGFDTCTICSCNNVNLTVRCARTECPRLPCAESEARRVDKSCCKVCPDTTTARPDQPSPHVMKDEGMRGRVKVSGAEILAGGGCRDSMGSLVENGFQYHPKSLSVVFKCIVCTCKDGTISCSSKHCYKDDTGPCCDRQRHIRH
uniref:Dorsal-ventral patterning protein Sog n=1 Tax=Cacopsylla melanoneura TaxID=428564 RepID=A0A8D8Y573_9HEMI